MSHVPVPSQKLWSLDCLCVYCIFNNVWVREVLLNYTIFYLGRFRAFHKEWYSTLVEGLIETSRFVNSSVFLVVEVHAQSFDIYLISLHFLTLILREASGSLNARTMYCPQ